MSLATRRRKKAEGLWARRCAGGTTGAAADAHQQRTWSTLDQRGQGEPSPQGGALSIGQQRLEKIIGYGTDSGMVGYRRRHRARMKSPSWPNYALQNRSDCASPVQLKGTTDSLEGDGAGGPASPRNR